MKLIQIIYQDMNNVRDQDNSQKHKRENNIMWDQTMFRNLKYF